MSQIEAEHQDMQITFRNRVFIDLDDLLKELDLMEVQRHARSCDDVSFIDCTFLKLEFICWHFNNCVFSRSKFEECYFDGTQFLHSKFEHCRLMECSLRQGVIPLPGFRSPGGGQTRLIQLEMNHVIFSNCDLTEAYFKDSKLTGVEFQDSIMYATDLMDCHLKFVSIHRCVLNATRFRYSFFEFCDISNSSVNEETQFSLLDNHDYYNAFKIYYQTFKLFQAQGLDDISLEFFFWAKRFERLSATNRYYRWWLCFLQYSCGYGEKPKAR